MAIFKQEFLVLSVLLCVGVIQAQHQQVQGSPDKAIRLEDIERDNLNSQAQKEQVVQQLPNNYNSAAAAQQQQLAAYQQQQYYLQQLQQQQQQVVQQAQHSPQAALQVPQQQLLLPQAVPYNGLPVMIIQQPLVDQLTQYYLMQQQLAALQYQPVAHALPAQALPHHGFVPQVVHILPQHLNHAQAQQQQSPQPQPPQQQPTARPALPNNKPFRPSPPLIPAQPRPQTQTLVYTQQHYNPYNTIYQQQQQHKFLSKSTPSPPLKESQISIQQPSQYAAFKAF